MLKTKEERWKDLHNDWRYEFLMSQPEMRKVWWVLASCGEDLSQKSEEELDLKYLDILEERIKTIKPRTEPATVNGEEALIFFMTKKSEEPNY
jgi:hypothetical protein